MIVNFVGNEVEVLATFAITNGVKQGCVLVPTIFSILLPAKLEEASRDMDSVYIQSRQNADLFTLQKQGHKYTCTKAAFRRGQRTDCLLSSGDKEDC